MCFKISMMNNVIFASKALLSFQAIRQWDQALRERNDYRDMLAKVQRQHEEAVKDINQAMAVRIKVNLKMKIGSDHKYLRNYKGSYRQRSFS